MTHAYLIDVTKEIGDEVVCDICNDDFTTSEKQGGLVFDNYGGYLFTNRIKDGAIDERTVSVTEQRITQSQFIKNFISTLLTIQKEEIRRGIEESKKEFETQADGEYNFGKNQKIIGYNKAIDDILSLLSLNNTGN